MIGLESFPSLRQGRCVLELTFGEAKAFVALEDLQALLLERRVVVVVDTVVAAHGVTVVEQLLGTMEADKARSSGDENPHISLRVSSYPCSSRGAGALSLPRSAPPVFAPGEYKTLSPRNDETISKT